METLVGVNLIEMLRDKTLKLHDFENIFILTFSLQNKDSSFFFPWLHSPA
jgi:hypothetical protein